VLNQLSSSGAAACLPVNISGDRAGAAAAVVVFGEVTVFETGKQLEGQLCVWFDKTAAACHAMFEKHRMTYA
jgi:hypothetical protein